MLRRPLLPASPPPTLTRTVPGGRSSSSWTTISCGGSVDACGGASARRRPGRSRSCRSSGRPARTRRPRDRASATSALSRPALNFPPARSTSRPRPRHRRCGACARTPCPGFPARRPARRSRPRRQITRAASSPAASPSAAASPPSPFALVLGCGDRLFDLGGAWSSTVTTAMSGSPSAVTPFGIGMSDEADDVAGLHVGDVDDELVGHVGRRAADLDACRRPGRPGHPSAATALASPSRRNGT